MEQKQIIWYHSKCKNKFTFEKSNGYFELQFLYLIIQWIIFSILISYLELLFGVKEIKHSFQSLYISCTKEVIGQICLKSSKKI